MKNNLGNKNTMSDNIKYYMNKQNRSATEICEILNIPKSTFSNWCNAVTYPRIDKIEMLANLFGITKADLVEEREDSYYLDKDAAALADFLKDSPGHRVLFDASRKIKPEDVEKAVAILGVLADDK